MATRREKQEFSGQPRRETKDTWLQRSPFLDLYTRTVDLERPN